MAVPSTHYLGPNGFYYRKSDSCGPYVVDESGNAVLLTSLTAPASDAIQRVGAIANPSASFTRPNDTTAYAVGDLIANSTTAGSVTPMSFANVARVAAGAAAIIKARLTKTGTGIVGAAFRLHLYSASPTVTNGDDGAFLPNQAANYLGAFEFGTTNMRVHSDGVACNGVTQTGYPITVDLSSGTTIYGLVEAAGAYVRTAAETFTFTLEVEQE